MDTVPHVSTVDPEGRLLRLRHQWEAAAVDLPVPDRLLTVRDRDEWKRYLHNLRPAQAIRKFGEAIDMFLDQHADTDDFSDLTSDRALRLYSLWRAVDGASDVVAERLRFAQPDKTMTYVDMTLLYVVDFLKDVRSAELGIWEGRQQRHAGIYSEAFMRFLCRAGHIHTPPAAETQAPAP